MFLFSGIVKAIRMPNIKCQLKNYAIGHLPFRCAVFEKKIPGSFQTLNPPDLQQVCWVVWEGGSREPTPYPRITSQSFNLSEHEEHEPRRQAYLLKIPP
jgi:hypothetical protein